MLVVGLLACGGGSDAPTTDTAVTTIVTTTVTITDTAGPVVDCAAIPPFPTATTAMDGPRGYHDVVFDKDGHIIGSDGNSLLKVTYDGTIGVFLPGTGVVQGMDWLDNGDLVYADGIGSLIRVTPAGAASVMVGGSGAYSVYGVTVGPDGMVYIATWTTVDRIDPATGTRVTIVDDPAVAPYVLDFSPDYKRLYVGTIWRGGAIWAVDLDANLDPVGAPALLATVGTGAEQLHDALGVDYCGNLYVAEFYTSTLYRVTPVGVVTQLLAYDTVSYGHGLEWGSGIGGWRTDALYVPQPYNNNSVMEVVIGVPSRRWAGTSWPD